MHVNTSSKAVFFDDLVEDGEVTPARPQGVLKGPAQRSDKEASTSINAPHSSTQVKFNVKKRAHQEEKL